MQEKVITYEQPINEHVRVCLRLERLFQQIDHTLRGHTMWDSRATVSSLLEILYLLDRPDLKTKLAKEISRYISNFTKLTQRPDVDHQKLNYVLAQLETINEQLHRTSGKFAQALRENELLNSVRQYAFNPGGACDFEVPVYHCWLNKLNDQRIQDLTNWLKQFETIREAIALLLCLIRESAAPQDHEADQGFFQTTLDPHAPCQLVRVFIPKGESIYPEISVGRHGIFIRFFQTRFLERPRQIKEKLPFKMACCIL